MPDPVACQQVCRGAVGRISVLICTLLLYDATAVAAQATGPPVSLSQILLLSIAVILLFAV